MGVELSHPCRNRTPRSLARRPFTSGDSSEPAKLCFKLLLLFVVFLYAIPAQVFPALEVLHPAQVIAIAALALLVLEKFDAAAEFRLGLA